MTPALLALVLSAVAPIPDAPKPQPPHMDRVQWSLLAADAGVRALDVYSTHRMLQRGWHEELLPQSLAKSTPAMAAYSGAVVAGEFFAARYLVQHHHPRIAKVLTSIDIAQDGYCAFHNLTLK